jgi:hypothetical protein
MFDNWFKSLDEIHTYKYWKKQIIQWNEKTIQSLERCLRRFNV